MLPAWVAEMDYALAPEIEDALVAAVRTGITGYPRFDDDDDGDRELDTAYAGFAARHFGHEVDPGWVLRVVAVTAGMRVALDALSEPGPMVMPVPAYAPQLDVPAITGRERVDLVLDPDAERAEIDLDRLAGLFRAAARTLLLTQPHNPVGPGVHPGRARGGPQRAPGAAGGRARPLPVPRWHRRPRRGPGRVEQGLQHPRPQCAQMVVPHEPTRTTLRGVSTARNDSWASLGVVGAVAAYTLGDRWLASLIQRLDQQRTLLDELLAQHLPEARMRPLEGTYGHADPAAVALEHGRSGSRRVTTTTRVWTGTSG